jgi:hypothetical protein
MSLLEFGGVAGEQVVDVAGVGAVFDGELGWCDAVGSLGGDGSDALGGPFGAAAGAGGGASACVSVGHVVFVATEVEVVGADTGSVVAVVEDHHAGRDGSVGDGPCVAVG